MRITEILKKCVRDKTATPTEAMAILSAVNYSADCKMLRFDDDKIVLEILERLVKHHTTE